MSRKKINRTSEEKREIRNRIGLIVFLSILIIALLSFDFYYREFQNWSTVDENLNIFLLINLNVILLITVTLLLFRNLIKLLYERKKRVLGFRLKSKLTLAFVLISTLPMLVFFLIANGFLTNSLNFWFQGQFSVVLRNSAMVVKNFSDHWEEDLSHFASVIVLDITKENTPPLKNDAWFAEKLFYYRLDGITLYDRYFHVQNSWFANREKEQLWTPVTKEQTMRKSDLPILKFNDPIKNGHIYRALIPITLNHENYFLEVSRILPGLWSTDVETIRKRLREYEKLLRLEEPIRTNYTAYLLLFTLLIIFACTWFGFYLARSIVVPIETLVEGTRRIIKGELDFQLDLYAEDEVGMLVNAFNTMTRELQQNKEKLASSRDELIRSYEEQEKRNVFVELVLYNIQSGVFSIDNSGFATAINEYLIKLFQLKPAKFLGRHYRTILNREQLDHFEILRQKLAASSQGSIRDEVHIKLQNNKAIRVSLHLLLLKSPQGDPMGQLLVVDNLTELDRSTRARAWREVARRIAHEIKNPLTPIQLSAQRIRRKYIDQLDDAEVLDSCTSNIISEVGALKNMVNEFSKFARLPEINPTPGNLNRIMEDIYTLFTPALPANISIKKTLCLDLPDALLDTEQIKRVFTNLVDNAVAAIDGEEGMIELETAYSNELKILIAKVKDTGKGISDHIGHRVFDPYVTSKPKGSGLGLAIVQQIISDHGGFIRHEPNKPAGTIFFIELPVYLQTG